MSKFKTAKSEFQKMKNIQKNWFSYNQLKNTGLYKQTLITCYAAGIPFLKNTLLGDLVYWSVLFGAFEFAQYKFPVLRYNQASTK